MPKAVDQRVGTSSGEDEEELQFGKPLLQGVPSTTSGTYGTTKSTSHLRHPSELPENEVGKRTHCKRYSREILVSLMVAAYAISAGFVLGFSSPTTPKLKASGVLSPAQATWYQSLSALGMMAGSILSCIVIQITSRKRAIYTTTVPLTAGWLCMIIGPESYVLLYLGRFFTGLAAGMLVIAVVLYIAETVSTEIRGAMLMLTQLGVTVGILILYSLGIVLNLRWLSVVSLFPVVVVVIGLLFVPESPRWLILKSRREEAIEALAWLRKETNEAVMAELEEIERNIHSENVSVNTRSIWQQLLKLWKPLTIGTILFIFQSLVGYSVILFNVQEIFAGAGFTSSNGTVPAIIIAAVKVLFVFVTAPMVDKFGRRRIMIIGGVLMGFSSGIMGFYFYYQGGVTEQYAWVTVVALILYMGCYAISWGTIPWVFIAESIPLQFRGWAPGLATAVCWVSAFILLSTYAAIVDAIALSGLFWLFASICFVGSLFVVLFMFETSQKSLESIEHEFSMSVHST